MIVQIYGIVCPMSGEIRYIGKTNQSLEKRLIAHLTGARRGGESHKNRWIRKCLDAGLRPSMWLLETIPEGESWQSRERKWIRRANELGFMLTNQTAGGEGLDFIDPDEKQAYRQKLSISLKKAHAERPEIREAVIAGNKRSWAENKEQRIAATRAGWTPEKMAKHRQTMEAISQTPEFRSAKANGIKRAWAADREKFMEAFARPETKAKQAEAAKASWADPEKRAAKMSRWTPEARAKMAALAASPEKKAKIKAAMTPEVRAKQAASLKANWAKRKAAKESLRVNADDLANP